MNQKDLPTNLEDPRLNWSIMGAWLWSILLILIAPIEKLFSLIV
jgi:hypothetical protein